VENQELTETEIGLFAHALLQKTGLRFEKTRKPVLERVLRARLKATATENVADYCRFLASDCPRSETEMNKLVNALTVKETYFFRDAPQWLALQDHVLPRLLSSSTAERRPLRIWSAGCSTGEEPYTLALILREHFGDAIAQIHATDIDGSALGAAIRGEYGARSVRRLDRRYLAAYFQVSGDRYVLDESVRKMVHFAYLNLADVDFRSREPCVRDLDLILCRNVIIYFPKELSHQLVARFSECLRDGGYLVLGHAETQYQMPDLRLEQYDNAFFCRKTGGDSPFNSPAAGCPSILPKKATTSTFHGKGKFPPAVLAEHDHLKLGERYLDQNRASEGFRELVKAVAQNPLSTQAHLVQGIWLKAQGEVKESVSRFKKVLYLDHECIMGRYHLADSYRRLGDVAGAHREYSRLLALLGSGSEEVVVDYSGGMTRGVVSDLCRAALAALER
jgi:chemotaxis protein methyltransferase CheR